MANNKKITLEELEKFVAEQDNIVEKFIDERANELCTQEYFIEYLEAADYLNDIEIKLIEYFENFAQDYFDEFETLVKKYYDSPEEILDLYYSLVNEENGSDSTIQLVMNHVLKLFFYNCVKNNYYLIKRAIDENIITNDEELKVLKSMDESTFNIYKILNINLEKATMLLRNVKTYEEIEIVDEVLTAILNVHKSDNQYVAGRIMKYKNIYIGDNLLYLDSTNLNVKRLINDVIDFEISQLELSLLVYSIYFNSDDEEEVAQC